MKLVLAFLFFAAAFPVTGQHFNSETELTRHATQVCRTMSRQLQLHEQEYIQVKKLTMERLRAIQENYVYHPILLRRKLQEAESKFQRQITYTLNAGQVEQYLAANPGAELASGLREMP